MNETLDAVLTRLRTSKGLSQLQVAEKLCEVSGMATVTRHEVSRWERGERTPSDFWLGWLAQVLGVPVGELESARVRAKPEPKASSASGKAPAPPRRSTTAAGSGSSAVVSLEYKHRATSVQLKGTYEEPSQAAAVIELFPMMVAPGATGLHVEQQRRSGAPRTAGESSATGGTGAAAVAVPRAVMAPAGAQQRAPASAALTVSGSSRVPMGIRYTKGPGTPPRAANGSTADSTRGARDDR